MRDNIILESLLKKIDTLELSKFLKKIYEQVIRWEKTSNDFELRKYELEDEIYKLKEELLKFEEEKTHLETQIKPPVRTIFGSPSDPTENITIREEIEKISIYIINKQDEITEKDRMLTTFLYSSPGGDKFENIAELRPLVIELKNRIDKYNTYKMMRKKEREFTELHEQLKRQREITKKIKESIENPQKGFIGTNWEKTVATVKSILGEYSVPEDADDATLPPGIVTNPSLRDINDTVIESGREQINRNLAETSMNIERVSSIRVQYERQNSVDIRKADDQLRVRLEKLKEIIKLLREKIEIKNIYYIRKRSLLDERPKITELKIRHVIILKNLGEDIEKINKEIEHIEKLLKLINDDDRYVNTIKENLEKYCFPILYQEFENIYNLESIRNIIQKRIPAFNIKDRVDSASSETPLTVKKIRSATFQEDDFYAFVRWAQQKTGTDYGKLKQDHIGRLYEEFKQVPRDIPSRTESNV